MSHAAQMEQRNSLIFIPARSLVQILHRSRWPIILLILLALSIFTLPTANSNTTVQNESVESIAVPTVPTLNDKVVKYMMTINQKLDKETAYQLAAAIIAESEKYHIPVSLQLGVITVESRFDQFAISNAGALGFYQIMPTAHYDKVQDMYVKGEIDTKNLYDPMTQAALGNKILYDCLRAHHHRLTRALQCYNGSTASTEYAENVMKRAEDAKEVIASL